MPFDCSVPSPSPEGWVATPHPHSGAASLPFSVLLLSVSAADVKRFEFCPWVSYLTFPIKTVADTVNCDVPPSLFRRWFCLQKAHFSLREAQSVFLSSFDLVCAAYTLTSWHAKGDLEGMRTHGDSSTSHCWPCHGGRGTSCIKLACLLPLGCLTATKWQCFKAEA